MVMKTILLAFLLVLSAAQVEAQLTRRARHLNPSDAGATLVYDARFITGLNDGDAISTWTDRSSSANNLTQTSTQRPLFKTAIKGGNPVVRFDGSNDVMNSTSTIGSPAAVCVICTFKASNNAVLFHRGSAFSDFGSMYLQTASADALWLNGNGIYTANASGKSTTPTGWGNDSAWHVASQLCNSTHASHTMLLDGVTPTLSNYSTNTNNPSTAGSLTMRVGAYSSAGATSLNGDYGSFCYFPVFPSSSLVRRISQAAASSFKIAQ